MTLSAAEREMGFVEFECDVHGFLVATTSKATVWCRCGKRARIMRAGRLLDPDTLKPTRAKARATNKAGHAFLHACGDCGEDFGGEYTLRRHRVGGKRSKRCLSPQEMLAKGLHQDAKGRWRRSGDDLRRLEHAQVSEAVS